MSTNIKQDKVKKDEVNVWLSFNQLAEGAMKAYLDNARKSGAKKVNFLIGRDTMVKFSILINQDES